FAPELGKLKHSALEIQDQKRNIQLWKQKWKYSALKIKMASGSFGGVNIHQKTC
ncbi:hypothetical protein C1645_841328, partial [Glomus cerebriforme]